MRVFLSAIVVLAFAGITAAEDKKDEKIDAKKLIGKWEPAQETKGLAKGVVEFAEGGKFILTISSADKTEKTEGTYSLQGNKLALSMVSNGMELKETYTLSKLTDDEMTGKNSSGKEETLKRIKPKK